MLTTFLFMTFLVNILANWKMWALISFPRVKTIIYFFINIIRDKTWNEINLDQSKDNWTTGDESLPFLPNKKSASLYQLPKSYGRCF